jgi:hypothetical protein
MRIGIPTSAVALLTTLLLAIPPASAEERCEIRYTVRLQQGEGGPDTGSAIRALSTCVSSLTYCHTHAETLAREHARETLENRGSTADVESVSIVDIKTQGDCD